MNTTLDRVTSYGNEPMTGRIDKPAGEKGNAGIPMDINDTMTLTGKGSDSSIGVYDQKTLLSLSAENLKGSDSRTPMADESLLKQPLKYGMSGDRVTRFQEALKNAVPLEVTGTFDDGTLEAVKKFQDKKGIDPDGVVGNITFAHLWAENFWQRGIVSDLRGPEFYDSMPENVSIKVSIKDQRAYLLDPNSGEVLREYPVATGKSPYNTPTGHWNITEIKEKPSWYPPSSGWANGSSVAKPGPKNPLGPVKMRLGSTSVLFHGVPPNEYDTIGIRPASHGCMRMFPQDAWELHNIIKTGTSVTISKD